MRPFVVVLALAISALAAAQQVQPVSNKPEMNRFTPVTIVPPGELDEPMAFAVLPNGRVYIIERKGALKTYDPATKTTKVIETLRVNTKYAGADGTIREAEEGLLGLTLDPKFESNHFIYMLYAEPTVTKHVLARWEINNYDELIPESKKVILEYGTQREVCCHTGGGMTWDTNGNLYLGVGNNTGSYQGSQTDERPGKANWDDQRTAANTNDLRGKILRIHPEPDGTYTIPAGNLFPPGTPNTRPEIFAMGMRNPWRIHVDSKTGFVYWGEVGPDASEDTAIGPKGYDEFNQARQAGNFGWPYFIADNQAFPITDYKTNRQGPKKDPSRPTNTSVNNSGLRELPPAQPAFIYYPYGPSDKFPELGTGSRSATGGPIYRRADFPAAKRPFPAYFEGRWIVTDLMRGIIMSIGINEAGQYTGMERFLPSYKPVEAIDMRFGPDGDLYVLEYGSNWFRKSDNSRLVRIEYNAGNRAPAAKATATKTGGTVPVKTTLSAKGSTDPDGDALKYEWSVEPESGGSPRVYRTPDVSVSLDKKGVYFATLKVTDPGGLVGETLVTLVAGNEPPTVALDVPGNKTFFFPGKPLPYTVTVRDREDAAAAPIPPDRVAFSIDYVPETFDVAWLKQGDDTVGPATRFAVARALIGQSDCASCHNLETKSNGPSLVAIADKYAGDAAAPARLVEKIRAGGTGVWGDTNMPAHPGITPVEARSIVDYILNVKSKTINALPLAASHTPQPPAGDPGRGSIVFRAVYTDKGGTGLLPHTVENVAVRRSSIVEAVRADDSRGTFLRMEANGSVETIGAKPGAYLLFRNIDLTGIKQLTLAAQAPSREGFKGGTIELRAGSPTGELLGTLDVPVVGGAGGTVGTALVMPLKESPGVKDVYLVFKSATAKPDDPIIAISLITFVAR